MHASIPPKILSSLVRTQFYTKIDWRRCTDLDPDALEKELRAVVGHIIDNDAAELPAKQKSQLTNEILSEVRELGCQELIEVGARLGPKISLTSRLRDALQRMGEWKHRKTCNSS